MSSLLAYNGTGFDPTLLRRVYAVGGSTYPFWQAAAPDTATDPALVWWLVGAAFPMTAALSLRLRAVERQLQFFWPSWLVTIHLYTLMFLNPGDVFYVVASPMAAAATVLFIRDSKPLVFYCALVVVLGAALLFAQGSESGRIYWVGILPVILLAYHRGMRQLSAAALTRQYQAELEEAVYQRTREIIAANERLQSEIDRRGRLEDELRLRQLRDAVARFAGGVAHEFHNLLMTIRAYSDLLERATSPDDTRRKDIERIRTATRQATVLTKKLLALGRPQEAGRQVCDLNALLRASQEMLRYLVPENIELRLEIDPGGFHVAVGKDQLEQVILNLVLNARDAMPRGGRLNLRTSRWLDEPPSGTKPPSLPLAGEWALLDVEDTGLGIDAETRQRVFEPFFTTKPPGCGTGMGLWTVYSIVTEAGGSVQVSSEPGQGARFALLWPLVDAHPSNEELERVRDAGRGETILLVEDRHDLRDVLRKLLSLDGYEIVNAESGDSALARLAEEGRSIRAVVTDAVLPGMHGTALAARVRERYPWLKVLVFSVYPGHPSLRGFNPSQGVEFLAKPFQPDELSRRLRGLLDEPLTPAAEPDSSPTRGTAREL